MIKTKLLEKIENKTAVVGVIGLGYVGLPFAVEKAKVGFRVIGIEQNPERCEKVNAGENYIGDVSDEELKKAVENGLLSASPDFDSVPDMDVIVICVPTPLTKNLAPDLQYVMKVTGEVAARLRPGQLLSLESTTYPGTTEEVMLPILENSGLRVEKDFFLAHSPERVDPGNKRYTTKNTNKVVGGAGPESLGVAMAFYGQTILNLVPVSCARAAELTKVFENTYRAVNIALVNELTVYCDKVGLNIWEVLDAAFTKPFGIQPFYPGPGVGGHCIPLDPHYLEWKARDSDFTMRFIGLAGEINRRMPYFVREKVWRVLNGRGKAVSKSKILVIGLAYKKDIADWRESPALPIIRMLREDGADMSCHDPMLDSVPLGDGGKIVSIPLEENTLRNQDLVLIITEHSEIDWQWVVDNSCCVLDTRNATRNVKNGRDKITLL